MKKKGLSKCSRSSEQDHQ